MTESVLGLDLNLDHYDLDFSLCSSLGLDWRSGLDYRREYFEGLKIVEIINNQDGNTCGIWSKVKSGFIVKARKVKSGCGA
ncbi:MAG: hypothetical protein N3D12_05435 [Candidatus Methanomethyliaceae archaeon]|nr:hypothetical protein [Candidatus Methanomethyliaceae archaeon]